LGSTARTSPGFFWGAGPDIREFKFRIDEVRLVPPVVTPPPTRESPRGSSWREKEVVAHLLIESRLGHLRTDGGGKL
jgi:hypothetical protein